MSASAAKRWLPLLVVAGLLVAGLVASQKKDTIELLVYTTGAERMLDGEEIYRTDDLKPFTYPPFFALPFVPLVPLSEAWQRAVFFLVNFASLAIVIALVRRIVAPVLRAGGRSAAWFWVPTAFVSARHVTAVFENQSHDMLVLLAIAVGASAVARCREAVGGASFGVAAACKATPLLFLPVLVAQRRLVAALAMVVAAAGATLIPDLLLPRDDGRLWVVAWIDTFVRGIGTGGPAQGAGAWNAFSVLNQSLAGTTFRLFTPLPMDSDAAFTVDVAIADPGADAVRVITIGARLLVVALIAWAAWPGRARGLAPHELGWRRFGEVGAVVCGMVLLSPMSSKSHFCVLLLPVAYCVAEHFFRRRSLVALTLLTVAFVLGLVSMKGVVGRQFGNLMLGYGAVAWAAFAVLLATAAVLVRPVTMSGAAAPGSAQPAVP